MHEAGEALGTVFVDEQALASAHGSGGVHALIIATEHALTRAFGPKPGAGFHANLSQADFGYVGALVGARQEVAVAASPDALRQ